MSLLSTRNDAPSTDGTHVKRTHEEIAPPSASSSDGSLSEAEFQSDTTVSAPPEPISMARASRPTATPPVSVAVTSMVWPAFTWTFEASPAWSITGEDSDRAGSTYRCSWEAGSKPAFSTAALATDHAADPLPAATYTWASASCSAVRRPVVRTSSSTVEGTTSVCGKEPP